MKKYITFAWAFFLCSVLAVLNGLAMEVTQGRSTTGGTSAVVPDDLTVSTITANAAFFSTVTAYHGAFQTVTVANPLSQIEVSTTVFNGVTYTWPLVQGSSGTVLKNNGSGALSWSLANIAFSSGTSSLSAGSGWTYVAGSSVTVDFAGSGRAFISWSATKNSQNDNGCDFGIVRGDTSAEICGGNGCGTYFNQDAGNDGAATVGSPVWLAGLSGSVAFGLHAKIRGGVACVLDVNYPWFLTVEEK